MTATVFCSFDSIDTADLAMGQLKSCIHGIYDIAYVPGYGQKQGSNPHASPEPFDFSAKSFLQSFAEPAAPSHSVMVKIHCDGRVKKQVMAALVNLRAFQIVG